MKTIAKIMTGSHMFGTNTETSDVDIAEIYMCDADELLGLNYKEHDDVDKDYRRYELGKFIRLLMNGNPNMLEILYAPADCILEHSMEWETLQENAHRFLTKKVHDTFCGYARTQINKSKGLNKKINWEKEKITRKDVLDFCYIIPNGETASIPIKKWLDREGYKQEWCGLVNVDHMKDIYLLYVDELEYVSENPRFKDIKTHKYNGIIGEDSNEVRLSSVPKYVTSKGVFSFNRDGYSVHCKDYREYEEWLSKRNEERYNTNKKHGQAYDGKNIAHNVRLLYTVKDVLLGNGLIVRRNTEEVKYLLKIKHGEVNLEEIVKWVESEYKNLEELKNNSTLPDEIDFNFCNQLLINLRKNDDI